MAKEVSSNSIHIDSIFYDLQRFAFDGCTFAEMVAQSYRKRPCFKKIDLLLSRLKNDLNVYHNILSNINSQGTAWAIKDFTFAYTRIINAWVILRGYVYDQTEGLNSLRSEFDPEFMDSFCEWQAATLKMTKSLMRSIEKLNVSVQMKSGVERIPQNSVFKRNDGASTYSEEFLETFQRTLFTPKCAPNSEEIQLRNHHSRAYFRAGVLKPLMIDNNGGGSFQVPSPGSTYADSATMTPSPTADELFSWWATSPAEMQSSPGMQPIGSGSGMTERLYNRGKNSPMTPETSSNVNPFDFSVPSHAKKTLLDQFNSIDINE
jgi:hypothetical protein